MDQQTGDGAVLSVGSNDLQLSVECLLLDFGGEEVPRF
jgi:hypothetical protein